MLPRKTSQRKLIPVTAAIPLPAVIALAVMGGALTVGRTAVAHESETREIAAATSVPVTLDKAIVIAESKAVGRALKATAEDHDGTVFYRVTTVADGMVYIQRIDAQTGEVLKSENEGSVTQENNRERGEDFGLLAKQSGSLASAITAAETMTGGKALEADFGNENGKPMFHVEIAKDGKIQKTYVDGASSKVIKAAMLDNEDENEDDGDHENNGED